MSKRKHPVRRLAGLVTMMFCLGTGIAHAQASAFIPAAPKLASESYILMDADSGKILAAEKIDEPMHPASLTKMMTSYIGEAEVAEGNIGRQDKVLVSEKAWRMGGSTMFIEVGDRVPVEELLKGIIIVSGNDASVALAEHIAGSEEGFAQMMNGTARKLGMVNTHYVNSSGWPAEDHYSTVRDLAILSRHIIQDYPEDYALYAQKYYQYGVNKRTGEPLRRQANRNRLLWTNPSVDGLKTGHIEATGYHLAATAHRDGRRMITVIMGANSEKQRAEEAQKLLTYGFRFFENVDIKSGGQPLESVRIWKGADDAVNVMIEKDLIVTVPRGTGKELTAVMKLDSAIEAPITRGQQLGSLKVMRGEEVVKEVPLLAQRSVERGSIFKVIWDSIVMFFSSLF